MIKKKDYSIGHLIPMVTLGVVVVVILILDRLGLYNNISTAICIGLLILSGLIGSIYIKRKCHCPHCGSGKHFFVGYALAYGYELTMANIYKKASFKCPVCENEIIIVRTK